tara:strand:+ start:378 stop:587 length:210 start_codon:yes stop_codon:yes gene_type:complete
MLPDAFVVSVKRLSLVAGGRVFDRFALRSDVVLLEGESLNSLFEELADWEHQLKALEENIPIEWEELSP